MKAYPDEVMADGVCSAGMAADSGLAGEDAASVPCTMGEAKAAASTTDSDSGLIEASS